MKNSTKIMAAALSVFLLVFAAAPNQLAAGICRGALGDCMIDALIAGIISSVAGPGSGLAVAGGYTTFCLVGYSFCLAYVEN